MRAIICGRGGGGVITLNMLMGSLATALGHNAISAETHGMAMRGGSVYTSLKINEGDSPAIEEGGADLILSVDSREVERNIKFLKKDGLVITDSSDTGETLYEIIRIDAKKIATDKFGNANQTGIILMGVVIGKYPNIFPLEKTLEILKENKKINIDALTYGIKQVAQ